MSTQTLDQTTDRGLIGGSPQWSTVRATGTWQGDLTAALFARDFEFRSSEPESYGGKNDAPNPMELLLGAVNGENTGVDGLAGALGTTAISETETETPEISEEMKEDAEHLIGFARIYSGTLSVGDEIYVLAPKFTPAKPHTPPEPQKVKVTALYLMMGRGLEPLHSVPAGCVFGIGGLEGHILKSGTICSQLPAISFFTPPSVFLEHFCNVETL